MKIIHLNCHSLPFKKNYIMETWPSRTAQYIQKYSNKYRHECWYAINNIKKTKTWKKNNITYRLFPAKSLNIPLESFFGIVFSPTLMKNLKDVSAKNDTIFHLQGERGLLVWQIINILKNKPIVLQFHGYRGTLLLRPIEKYIIETAEKHFFSFISYFFVHSKAKVNYLTKTCHIPPKNICFQNMGVDYDKFKPINKTEAKKKLNIATDKNVILHVGVFNKGKGVEKIIKAHLAIKNQQNTYLILIGGSKNDPLYQYCRQNADLTLERIPHQKLINYYQAADVYCMICPPERRKFAGLGIASVEALACNTPILNSNLDDAPPQIKNLIGYQVNNTAELTKKLIYIFSHKNKFRHLRQTSKPYFFWQAVVNNILKSYEKSQKLP